MTKVNDSKSWEQQRYKEMIKDLKKIETIYVVGLRKSNNQNWDKGIWRYFDIYYIKDNALNRVFISPLLRESQKPSSWNQEARCFEQTVLGSDRTHEIVYSLYNKVYPNSSSDALYKMPRIEFLSYFDGDNDEYDERESEEGEL